MVNAPLRITISAVARTGKESGGDVRGQPNAGSNHPRPFAASGGHDLRRDERELEASYHTVFRHLQALGAAGLVVPAGEEVHQGRRTIYTIDRRAVTSAIDDYKDYLLPDVASGHDTAERATDD